MRERTDEGALDMRCGKQNHAIYRLKRSRSVAEQKRRGLGWFDRRLGYVGWRTFGLAELEIGIGRCVLMRTSAHTASKYRWFADQCVERAQSAASSEEAVGYLQRASVWRRLADSRNEDGVGDNRFVRKKPLRKVR